MERFGFEIELTDPYTGKKGRFECFNTAPYYEKKEKEERERIERKALKSGKTVAQVMKEEKEKHDKKYLKDKYKRYTKEVAELKKELEYKLKWLEENKEKVEKLLDK